MITIRTLTGLRPALIVPRGARSIPFLLSIAALGAIGSALLAFAAPAEPMVLLHGVVLVDATSRLFLLVIHFIFMGIATYLWGRVRAEPALVKGLGRYTGLALAFMGASSLALLSRHLIGLWMFLELSTFLAVPLIQHGGGAQARRAAWKYFLFSSVGLALAFLGFACLAQGLELSGGHDTSPFLDGLVEALRGPSDVWQRLGLGLIFLGLGTKLGLAPMYGWLPETYDAAPPPTTALLAAVQFNVALVGVLRVLQAFREVNPSRVSLELVGLGLLTMAVSALHALAARNYKRLIAYAALNHGGVIAIGVGVGKGAAYGVVLYAVSNAFIKAMLFLTAGRVRAHYKTEQIAGVSGLIRELPYSGVFLMVGTFALLGLPPFGSFLGELILMSGLVGAGYFAVFAAFCAILTVTFAATGRALFPMIWGEPKQKTDWANQPLATAAPKLVFLLALVAMGVYLPPQAHALFRQVAESLGAP
jgi:hydrogenase-4 component F